MKKILIGMTDFVLAETKLWSGNENESYEIAKSCLKYAQFLKQPLELWMFVPCKLEDGFWKEIKEPKEYQSWVEIQKHGGYSLCANSYEYQKSLDRILFNGLKFEDVQPSTEYNYYHLNGNKIFEANNQYKFFPYLGLNTIEDLVKYNLELTPTAQKKIGL